MPLVATAHSPTSGGETWTDSQISNGSTYRWGVGVPSWLQPIATDALGPRWDSLTSNNSRHAHFSYASGGVGQVRWSTMSGCPGAWAGCTHHDQYDPNWVITLNPDPPPNTSWCQGTNPPSQANCYDARLIMIHEVAHVGGLDHNESGYLQTVMNADPPRKPTDGWNRLELRKCDAARLQLVYGVASFGGPYADCFEDIPNTPGIGLSTTISITPSTTVACLGEAVSFSGVLKVQNDTTNYGELAGNILPQRLITLEKSAVSPVSYVPYSSQATTASGTYTRWSAAYTSPQSWKFRTYRASEAGLEHSSSAQLTITWSTIC